MDDESFERDELSVVELYFGNIFWLWSKLNRDDKESFNGKLKPDPEFRKLFNSLSIDVLLQICPFFVFIPLRQGDLGD